LFLSGPQRTALGQAGRRYRAIELDLLVLSSVRLSLTKSWPSRLIKCESGGELVLFGELVEVVAKFQGGPKILGLVRRWRETLLRPQSTESRGLVESRSRLSH
jgi:hypothetical protein